MVNNPRAASSSALAMCTTSCSSRDPTDDWTPGFTAARSASLRESSLHRGRGRVLAGRAASSRQEPSHLSSPARAVPPAAGAAGPCSARGGADDGAIDRFRCGRPRCPESCGRPRRSGHSRLRPNAGVPSMTISPTLREAISRSPKLRSLWQIRATAASMASRPTGRFSRAFCIPRRSLFSSKGSRLRSPLTTVGSNSSAVSKVVNRSVQARHSRRRRICRPSPARRESMTLVSV